MLRDNHALQVDGSLKGDPAAGDGSLSSAADADLIRNRTRPDGMILPLAAQCCNHRSKHASAPHIAGVSPGRVCRPAAAEASLQLKVELTRHGSPMRLLVGTSGFAYKEWKPSFYPPDLPAAQMLRYYSERFPAVEINNTFYRMPSEAVLRDWVSQVPDTFAFALKAPQQITHRKRLKEVSEPAGDFFRIAGALGRQLAPAFMQLPPNLKKDIARLESFLGIVPEGVRVAFEFRNPTWFDEEVYSALRDANAALCIAHGEEVNTPFVATADWGYVRLRQVVYEAAELEKWADDVRNQSWSDAYVFFKHEDTGTGPVLAQNFRALFDGGGGA